MALDVVSDYITEARILLQDTVLDYRYADSELLTGLNMAILEAYKLRPDLFFVASTGAFTIPSFTANDATTVTFDQRYRVGLVYYICANAQLRDEEYTQDSRAAAFITMFKANLLGMQ